MTVSAPAQHEVEQFADYLIQLRLKRLRDDIKQIPRDRPILSDIPDCDRQMVYGVTHWKERPPIDADLKARFEAGNLQEEAIVRELHAMGCSVTRAQEYVEVYGRNPEGEKILLARGKIDGFVGASLNGKVTKFPMEIKSMDPNVFRRIRSLDDFRSKPHLRKYIRQMLMYLYGKEMEAGLFIVTDCLGHWKIIPIYLDLAECELILRRLEGVHKHMNAGTLPDRIPYSLDLCGRCPFKQTCLPDIQNMGLEIMDIPQMNEDLARIEILRPFHEEFEYLDDYNKAKARAYGKDFIAGDFYVKIKQSEMSRVVDLPPEISMKYSKKFPILRVEFDRLVNGAAPTDPTVLPDQKDINEVRTAHGDKPKRKKAAKEKAA